MHWQQMTLVGVGLLGGSLGMAVRQRRLATRVVGFVRRTASVAECEALGACDQAMLDLEAAVRGSDLIVLCTPIARKGGAVVKNSPANAGDAGDTGSIPGSGRSPG